MADPASLGDAIGDSPIFCLCTGATHRDLPFRRPRDKILSKEDAKSRRRAACVWTPSPIGVGVSEEMW